MFEEGRRKEEIRFKEKKKIINKTKITRSKN